MKKRIFPILATFGLLLAGAAVFATSAKSSFKQAKATDVGEIEVGEVRNAISNSTTMYLLPTADYSLPDSWDNPYVGVGEEDGVFINGVKQVGAALKYAGTGSAHITFYYGLAVAATEGDVIEFKGQFACADPAYSFTMNFAAQWFGGLWVNALEDYDVVSLADANMPNFNSGAAINTDDISGEYAYVTDPAGLPKQKGFLGLTNNTGSYAFQFNYTKTSTGTGWFHVLIGASGTLWSKGHFIDFGFLDAWANTGHAQIKEMKGKEEPNNWAADEIQATGNIALGWNVGETNLLEMGLIKLRDSNKRLVFFKVNNVLKFSEYWTLAEGAMTTKVTLQYAGTDATVTNSIEPASTTLSPSTYVPAAKQFYINLATDICPAVISWDYYFMSVDGNGLKLNGSPVGVSNWNYFKKTGATQMFLALGDIGVTPAEGDILYVGGMFKAARKDGNAVDSANPILYKVNFAGTYFQFDGENWHVIDPDYTAVAFSKDLLKQTLAICTGEGGNNGAALATIWATLAGQDYFGKLKIAEKEELVGTEAEDIAVPTTAAGVDEMSEGDAIAAAMYRYEYCTAKYSLTAFITGRSVAPSNFTITVFKSNSVDSAIIIIGVLTLSLCVVGICAFHLRKRKEDR